jgi:hypothetical protein
VVYGNPSAVWDFASVASGTLLSMVYRLCLAGAFVDSGFPTANVENLRPPTSTQDGVLYSGVNRGDYRLWKKIQDVESSAHWVDMAGDKPKDLLEAILAYESDFADQLGIPLSTTNAGGAPMDHQVAAQEEAIMAFADTFRSGDAVLLRRLAAIANRAGETGQLPGWSPVSEALPGLLYREEIEEAMEEAEPKPKPTTPDTTNDSTDTQGDDENAE